MNLTALQATLRQFAADRDWQPFQTPKNLAMALMVEAGELAEIFQWMTGEQSQQAHRDGERKQHIGEEVADVLFYLLQIADHSHIDLQHAVDAKLLINARKYPPARGVAELPPPPLPRDAGDTPAPVSRTHVLLDFENVQPDAEALRALVPDIARLWVFHGPHQKNVGRRLAGLPVTLVPISKTGKNALDFHLTFYVGFISSRHPDDKIVVVANDRGYEPMLMHARTMGFDVRLQTHVPDAKAAAEPAPARKAAAKTAPAKKAPAKKTPPKKAPAKKAATKPLPEKKVAAKKVAAKKAPARKAVAKTASQPSAAAAPPAVAKAAPVKAASKVGSQKLLENLRRMGDQRPTTRTPLLRMLQSHLGAGATPDDAAAALHRLQSGGHLAVTRAGRVSYTL